MMNRQIVCTGFCPTLNKEFQITVDYLDVSSLDHPNHYIRSLITCDFASWVHNDCPIQKDCPLLQKAPKERSF